MAFIQIIDIRTSNIDKIRTLDEEWEQATAGKRTLRRSILCQDRNDPKRYLVLAFFDSYESAMVNSELPETDAFTKQIVDLVDAPLTFQDLDVIEDRS